MRRPSPSRRSPRAKAALAAPRRRHVATTLGAALLFAGSFPAAAHAQREISGSRIDTTFAFRATGRIDISVPAGDIIVSGWNRDEVRVQARSERGDLEVHASTATLDVRASAVARRLGETRLELTVPRRASVTMNSHLGALTIRDFAGDVTANATSGTVVLADLTGTATLQTVTGDIRGERIGGRIKATAVNGNVVLQNADAEIAASTTNGRILLTAIRSRSVKAGSINGTVEFEGAFHPQGTYAFQAHNGNITFYIPDGTGATLEVGTFSGHLESDIPLTLGGGRIRGQQRYTFTLGGGGATISALSYSGNIFIRRAPRPNR